MEQDLRIETHDYIIETEDKIQNQTSLILDIVNENKVELVKLGEQVDKLDDDINKLDDKLDSIQSYLR